MRLLSARQQFRAAQRWYMMVAGIIWHADAVIVPVAPTKVADIELAVVVVAAGKWHSLVADIEHNSH